MILHSLSLAVVFTQLFFFHPSFGEKLEFSNDEKNALVAFRHIIKDIPLHDYQKKDCYLSQWLQAKKFNIPEAVKMFKESQVWRQENNMDNILNETIDRIPGYVTSMDSIDLQDHPIVTMSMSNLDLRKLILTGKRNNFLRYNFQILEKMTAKARVLSAMSGKEICQIYLIIDFHGYNKRQHECHNCHQTLLSWYTNALNYYPGLRFREVWINTPRIAEPLVRTIRALYSNVNNENLHIFSANRIEWSEFLRKSISSDQLTHQFGGSKSVSKRPKMMNEDEIDNSIQEM